MEQAHGKGNSSLSDLAKREEKLGAEVFHPATYY